MKYFLTLIISAFLSGCLATMPNSVSETKSTFDGTTQYKMEPGFIYENASFGSWGAFKLGLFWDTKMADNILVKAQINNNIVNIVSDEGLQFNIDGELIKLSSTDVTTDFESDIVNGVVYKNSSKNFIANKALINKLLSSKSAKVKLVTRKGFLEGDFKADKPSAAIRGFRDFMKKINSNK